MESSKMVQSLIGLRTLSQNWFRHFVASQWNESDLCWLWCWFMRWDNLLLVKYSDLHTLSNVSTWSRFTHFLVFWLDLAIYALCRILMKCRDLRIFPGTNYRFPGTKNFSTPLSPDPGKRAWTDHNCHVSTCARSYTSSVPQVFSGLPTSLRYRRKGSNRRDCWTGSKYCPFLQTPGTWWRIWREFWAWLVIDKRSSSESTESWPKPKTSSV